MKIKKAKKPHLGTVFFIKRQKTNSVFSPAAYKVALHSKGPFCQGPEGTSGPDPPSAAPWGSPTLPMAQGPTSAPWGRWPLPQQCLSLPCPCFWPCPPGGTLGAMLWPCLQPCPWPRRLQLLTGPPGRTWALAQPLTLPGAAHGPQHPQLRVTVPVGEGTAGAEPTGERFCSLPCCLQRCNRGVGSSTDTHSPAQL